MIDSLNSSSSLLSAGVYAFTTLLPVINPFSSAMFFCTATRNLNDRDRAYISARIALFSLLLLLVSLFAGHLILGFFGISVGVLRCAGGLVLIAVGWSALNAPPLNEADTNDQPVLSRQKLKTMAFYPYTLPLTVGPGAIAVTVALGTSMPYTIDNLMGTCCGLLLTVAVTWLCFRYSDRVNKAVGAVGTEALARIFAFILVCIGVSVLWRGFSELWLTLGTTS